MAHSQSYSWRKKEEKPVKNALWILGVLVAIAAIVAVVMVLRYVMAGPSGALNANDQIQSGQHRIVAYNHFFDLCAGVRADEVSLDAQNAQLETTTDAFQRTRVQTNITGLLGHRAILMEEYNANARKDYTEGQFRDSDLPYQLPTTAWEKGYRTPCGR